MEQKTKKIIFAVLVLAGIVFPLHKTYAMESLANLIATHLIGGTIKLFLSISNISILISSAVLDWVTSEWFINWNYTGLPSTNPSLQPNPVVQVGWTLTRDLTNMAFVIVLASIGLATALKLEQYKYQKLLFPLIGIALIINFSPVICGVIIDASNILMNFFLGKYSGFYLAKHVFQAQCQNIDNSFELGVSLTIILNVVCQAIIMSAINVWFSLIHFLFAFLFAGRYIAIWILVILSPIAWFAYIIPNFRSFWRKWWDWFIQWCFIGVTSAFFLYLSNHMLVRTSEMVMVAPASSGIWEGLGSIWVEFLNMVIPYSMSLGFAMIGLMLALRTSVIGSKEIISGAKTVGVAAGAFAGKQTLGRLARSESVQKGLGKLAEAPEKPGQIWAKMRAPEKGRLSRAIGAVGAGVDKVAGSPLRWTARKAATAGLQYATEQSRGIDAKKDEFKKKFDNWKDLAHHATSVLPLDFQGRTAMVEALQEMGGAEAVKELERLSPGYHQGVLRGMSPKRLTNALGYSPDMIASGTEAELKAIQDIEDIENKDDIGEVMPKIYSALKGTTPTAEFAISNLIKNPKENKDVQRLIKAGYKQAEAVVIAAFMAAGKSIDAKNIGDMPDKIFENRFFQDALLLSKPVNTIRAMYEGKSPEAIDGLEEAKKRIGATRLTQSNSRLARKYAYGGLAWESMAGTWDGLETKTDYQIQEKIASSDNLIPYYRSSKKAQESASEIQNLKKKMQTGQGNVKKAQKQGQDIRVLKAELSKTDARLRSSQGKLSALQQGLSAQKMGFSEKDRILWQEIEDMKKKTAQGKKKAGEKKKEDKPKILVPRPRGRRRKSPPSVGIK